MDDLIRRRDAIDIATQYCPDDDGSCSKADRDIRELLDDLENLPSVQPDIVRCKDCRYYEREGTKGYCNDLYGFGRYWEADDFCSYAERREE